MDGIISISSNSSETGSGAEDINIDYAGEKIEIGFNAKYLMEILSQIDSKKLNFKLLDLTYNQENKINFAPNLQTVSTRIFFIYLALTFLIFVYIFVNS